MDFFFGLARCLWCNPEYEILGNLMPLAVALKNFADDCSTLPQFRNAISVIALRILGPDGDAGFMEFFFG